MAETPKKPTTRKKTSASAAAPKAVAPKRKATASKVTSIGVSHEEIARLAHSFWAERGVSTVTTPKIGCAQNRNCGARHRKDCLRQGMARGILGFQFLMA